VPNQIRYRTGQLPRSEHGVLPPVPSGSMANSSGAEPVRYGIIGVGMMGRQHLRNLTDLDGVLITPRQRSRRTLTGGAVPESERAGIPRPSVFVAHRDLLTSGLCDAVVVASPNMTHAAVLADVLETGRYDAKLDGAPVNRRCGPSAVPSPWPRGLPRRRSLGGVP
jgi:hypothetical protein